MAGGRFLGIVGIIGRLLIAAFGIAMTIAGVLGMRLLVERSENAPQQ